MSEQHRVLVAIPTYRPSPELQELVDALVHAGLPVVVVDDGSGPDSAPILDALSRAGAQVLRNERNAGIAHSLNRALAEGEAQGRTWLYTLDQDSIPEVEFVREALSFAGACLSSGLRVGVLTPAANNSVRIAGRERGGVFHPFDPIQSGSLMSIRIAREVGGFRAEYFIDAVDSEMTARVRRAGYGVVSVPGTDMRHALGHRVQASIAGRRLRWRGSPITVNQHAPFRVYYMTRNGIVLSRSYFRDAPGWVVRRAAIELIAHAMRIILGRNRRTQLTAIAWGMADGLRTRMGPLDLCRANRLRTGDQLEVPANLQGDI